LVPKVYLHNPKDGRCHTTRHTKIESILLMCRVVRHHKMLCHTFFSNICQQIV
jgi:hypothetical protein